MKKEGGTIFFNPCWSSELAYAVGVISTDGCLSKDGRHIDITSKDIQLLETTRKCLNCTARIGEKRSGLGKLSHHFIISSVEMYRWLESIGLTPNKSKTLGAIILPKKYFADFFRGVFDGDGSFYSYWDKRWRSSFMYYLSVASASFDFINYLQGTVLELVRVRGALSKPQQGVYQLKYAKADTDKLIKWMYYDKQLSCLKRKYEKIRNACASGEMAYTPP